MWSMRNFAVGNTQRYNVIIKLSDPGRKLFEILAWYRLVRWIRSVGQFQSPTNLLDWKCQKCLYSPVNHAIYIFLYILEFMHYLDIPRTFTSDLYALFWWGELSSTHLPSSFNLSFLKNIWSNGTRYECIINNVVIGAIVFLF